MNAIHLYNVAHWCHAKQIPVVPKLLYWTTFLVYNSSIPPSAEIGAGTRFGYGGMGVVIHAQARIGRNVIIAQQVTIGGRQGQTGVPVIEDDVYLGAGAKILGPIRIGRGAVVGANAVVVKDVPAGATVGGVPARILKQASEGADG
ncbi:DapH/DapD/GlmU-related protein [Sorangium sp. So ce296]|uniref:serine O-acetyltransferase n=1 Tax=Sorangium sp. So ce296 TaxID=3133296 RepID=UPI003F62E70D